ncbi:MAG: hypothetical protein ABSA94_12260 [Acidobacteriaceae bacterium]
MRSAPGSRIVVALNDGTTLGRYSSPTIGAEGLYFGRIWSVTATGL